MKEAKFEREATKAERRINRNTTLIRSYNRTIASLESGKLQRGDLFIENFLMQYERGDERYD